MHPLIMLVAFFLLVEAVASDEPQQALPGCNNTCGDILVPYPFGMGHSTTQDNTPCYMDSKFELKCIKSKLTYGKMIPVLDINPQSQMVMKFFVSRVCTNSSSSNNTEEANEPLLNVSSFTISSTENKFITISCDGYGILNSNFKNATYSIGCLTRCHNYDHKMVIGNNIGKCTGLGCCQVDIPPLMKNITIQTFKFPPETTTQEDCSYSFIAKQGSYNFSVDHINNLTNQTFPMVVNWAVTNESCQIAKTTDSYACRENSECVDNDPDYEGYRCKCLEGFEGNPYLPGGCTDIDECAKNLHGCKNSANCINTAGNYTCFCPLGQTGDGTKEGGCKLPDRKAYLYVIGAILFLVNVWIIYSLYQKRKHTKLKGKFFRKNGGSILEQKLLQRKDSSSKIANIFKERELRKATNNYDESLIIGRGSFGTVFKGELEDNRIVAIKMSKTIDESQIEQFINEVDVVSQINHRNVVKLLGCCLETEVPLLVYEFVSNGTLSDFIHKDKLNNPTWKIRLKIATEVAGALSYLHSAASIPIIHRDVKSANILLDGTNTAKVSDFGASKLVPLDQSEIATMVKGTIGYLDPEYMLTNQLTEKSDVYSFGVVVVELLTGERPFSFGRPEERRNLATYFLSCFKKDNVFEIIEDGMLNEENKQEIKEVTDLAAKCLRLRGEERPSMKEVAMELETMILNVEGNR
ncbi:unnamed protein product [Trifolium pratense]|uniref:Uncharacterized protein n=1 Tax=Trifolium pratense TaxID=57577 RepID=A0ACB0M0L8_TRIPR|nr:unnamed protein product [Trifolium pratense]